MNRPIALAYAIAGLSAAIAIVTVVSTTVDRPMPPQQSPSELSRIVPAPSAAAEVVYVDEEDLPAHDDREEDWEHRGRDNDDDRSERGSEHDDD